MGLDSVIPYAAGSRLLRTSLISRISSIHQDLHWLTLIATHVMVEESDDSSSSSSAFAYSAPNSILQHLVNIGAQVDEQKTAEVMLASFGIHMYLLLKRIVLCHRETTVACSMKLFFDLADAVGCDDFELVGAPA